MSAPRSSSRTSWRLPSRWSPARISQHGVTRTRRAARSKWPDGLDAPTPTPLGCFAAHSMRPPSLEPSGGAPASIILGGRLESYGVAMGTHSALQGVRYFESVLDCVGDTPLVRIRSLARECPGPVLAKLEAFNPGGSVKDRIGL